MTALYTVTRRFRWDETLGMWVKNPEKPPSECEWQICFYIRPDRNGFSEWFDIAELQRRFPDCADRIGGNGSNMFTRQLAKDFLFTPDQARRKQGSRVVSRRAYGLVKARDEAYPIRADIRREVGKRPCAVLFSRAQIEVDHKDGRKDNWATNDTSYQQVDDFQALHKTANGVKREVCKKCEQSNQRFDARNLGFRVGWTEGGSQYQGSCRGCFWYDPIAFRQGA